MAKRSFDKPAKLQFIGLLEQPQNKRCHSEPSRRMVWGSPVTRENLPRAHRFVVLFDRGIATSATPPRNDTVFEPAR